MYSIFHISTGCVDMGKKGSAQVEKWCYRRWERVARMAGVFHHHDFSIVSRWVKNKESNEVDVQEGMDASIYIHQPMENRTPEK